MVSSKSLNDSSLIDLLPNEWRKLIEDFLPEQYWNSLTLVLEKEYEKQTVYPAKDKIFQAFRFFNPAETKVIIVGQDPYHGAQQANGLAFSVPESVRTPPSLRNIHKELLNCYPEAFQLPNDLGVWAQQGVLLLNDVLTVRAGEPTSHHHLNWQAFTNSILKALVQQQEKLVLVLWGKHAQAKLQELSLKPSQLVLSSAHPSPFSAHKGFLNSKVFLKINEYLANHKITTVNWT